MARVLPAGRRVKAPAGAARWARLVEEGRHEACPRDRLTGIADPQQLTAGAKAPLSPGRGAFERAGARPRRSPSASVAVEPQLVKHGTGECPAAEGGPRLAKERRGARAGEGGPAPGTASARPAPVAGPHPPATSAPPRTSAPARAPGRRLRRAGGCRRVGGVLPATVHGIWTMTARPPERCGQGYGRARTRRAGVLQAVQGAMRT